MEVLAPENAFFQINYSFNYVCIIMYVFLC